MLVLMPGPQRNVGGGVQASEAQAQVVRRLLQDYGFTLE